MFCGLPPSSPALCRTPSVAGNPFVKAAQGRRSAGHIPSTLLLLRRRRVSARGSSFHYRALRDVFSARDSILRPPRRHSSVEANAIRLRARAASSPLCKTAPLSPYEPPHYVPYRERGVGQTGRLKRGRIIPTEVRRRSRGRALRAVECRARRQEQEIHQAARHEVRRGRRSKWLAWLLASALSALDGPLRALPRRIAYPRSTKDACNM